ncbi:phage major capsid protein [Mycolicibacillus parakoreensis]|uniref:Phage major capsid protein n=1 Tax=Mycolicibacillus parakoreensis TaxID=1069221 RepID=A0ABY3TV60_9MYCO|nr:phage major capsid protein [Mycolicibacillus parakoreensis]MCV7317258.1 phage major capsid protein [Mycolicibacillus parakoreensis]ULN51530.1 phage major capsid protein [Mycolicibacillus parakoreensis]
MATNLTTNVPAAWRPDTTAYAPGDVVGDALLLAASTVVGTIEGDEPSVRVPYVSDDGTPAFVDEGDTFGDPGQVFSEAVISTFKLGALGKYSRELLAQPEAATSVSQSLSRAITKKANSAFIGNASDPTGLLNASIHDGGTVGSNLDELVDAVAHIESNGGAATHLIAHPTAWATLSKLKTGTSSEQNLLGAGVEAGQRNILGLPVLVDSNVSTGELLVVDKSAIVSAAGNVRLDRSEDAFFSADLVGVRIAWRIGWAVMHADRIVKVAVDDGTSS